MATAAALEIAELFWSGECVHSLLTVSAFAHCAFHGVPGRSPSFPRLLAGCCCPCVSRHCCHADRSCSEHSPRGDASDAVAPVGVRRSGRSTGDVRHWESLAMLLLALAPCQHRLASFVPSGANEELFPRGAPMQHLAPRLNPRCSNGHLTAWIRILISKNSENTARVACSVMWTEHCCRQSIAGSSRLTRLILNRRKGAVILTDAADATSSGATGNGATILAELLAQVRYGL